MRFRFFIKKGRSSQTLPAHFPNSEWNLETIPERICFYKQYGIEGYRQRLV